MERSGRPLMRKQPLILGDVRYRVAEETTMKRMLIAASVVVLLQCGTALGQGADFYKGKQVDLYVGYSVGGGYDIYARLLVTPMGKHRPGKPVVVLQNMAGAG